MSNRPHLLRAPVTQPKKFLDRVKGKERYSDVQTDQSQRNHEHNHALTFLEQMKHRDCYTMAFDKEGNHVVIANFDTVGLTEEEAAKTAANIMKAISLLPPSKAVKTPSYYQVENMDPLTNKVAFAFDCCKTPDEACGYMQRVEARIAANLRGVIFKETGASLH